MSKRKVDEKDVAATTKTEPAAKRQKLLPSPAAAATVVAKGHKRTEQQERRRAQMLEIAPAVPILTRVVRILRALEAKQGITASSLVPDAGKAPPTTPEELYRTVKPLMAEREKIALRFDAIALKYKVPVPPQRDAVPSSYTGVYTALAPIEFDLLTLTKRNRWLFTSSDDVKTLPQWVVRTGEDFLARHKAGLLPQITLNADGFIEDPSGDTFSDFLGDHPKYMALDRRSARMSKRAQQLVQYALYCKCFSKRRLFF
jgi:hypothetical protein